MAGKRCFLAVKMPSMSEYEKMVERATDGLDIKISITNPDLYHFTLHFFGDLQEKEIIKVKSVFDKFEMSPFKLKLEKPGVIPANKPRKVRVLHVEPTIGEQELIDLVTRVRSILDDAGFETETREYWPHLTVGRVKQGRDRALVHERWLNTDLTPIVTDVTEISLIHSDLTANGPEYTTLATFGKK